MARIDVTTDPKALAEFNITISDPDKAQRITNLLWDEILATQDEDIKAVGLAAPQAGIHAKVAVIKDPRDGSRIDLINPIIVGSSRPLMVMEEACMSFPGKRYPVVRYSTIDVEFQEVRGGQLERSLINVSMKDAGQKDVLLCQALQHEIDHLNGITIHDYNDSSSNFIRTESIRGEFDEQMEEIYKRLHTPIRRTHSKIGRNQSCPCGSGKKYKKCCINAPIMETN